MRVLQFGVLLGALARCNNSDQSGRGPVADNRVGQSLESRERMFFTGSGWILDVRVTDDGVPFAYNNGVYTEEGTAWPATVAAQLISRGLYAAPASVSLLLQRSRTEAESRESRPVDTARAQGLTQLERGARYLVILTTSLYSAPLGTIVRGYYIRVDANGRLLERALEFPAGTPVSTVLDASTMPRELLGDVDASAPSDGAVDGG